MSPAVEIADDRRRVVVYHHHWRVFPTLTLRDHDGPHPAVAVCYHRGWHIAILGLQSNGVLDSMVTLREAVESGLASRNNLTAWLPAARPEQNYMSKQMSEEHERRAKDSLQKELHVCHEACVPMLPCMHMRKSGEANGDGCGLHWSWKTSMISQPTSQ